MWPGGLEELRENRAHLGIIAPSAGVCETDRVQGPFPESRTAFSACERAS